VFAWNACTGEKLVRIKLAKNARGVSAVSISSDGALIATADKSNDHNVQVFDANAKELYKQKGGVDEIMDLAFSKAQGSTELWSAGVKHFAYHDLNAGKKAKGLFAPGGTPTSFACLATDDQGRAFAGGSNSGVYVWQGRQCQEVLKLHESGFVGAI